MQFGIIASLFLVLIEEIPIFVANNFLNKILSIHDMFLGQCARLDDLSCCQVERSGLFIGGFSILNI